MVAKISVKPSLKILEAKYKAASTQMSNTEIAHKKVAIYLDQWVQRNFKTEGGMLDGAAWVDYKYGGRAIFDAFFDEDNPPPGNWRYSIVLGSSFGDGGIWIDDSAKLLQDTGRLKFSFLPFANKKDAGIGSSLLYSKAHNEGTGDVPQRRILPERKEVHDRIHEILESHAKKSLGME